jgi:glycine dehydrogenase
MSFIARHLGINENNIAYMLKKLNVKSINQLTKEVNPLFNYPKLKLEGSENEYRTTAKLVGMLKHNKKVRPMMGKGFYRTITPAVIKRHILENPKWYTPYTPYQAEISQGRLESQYNYQKLIEELTNMDISNASLLDEASAGSEAMLLTYNYCNGKKNQFICNDKVYPHIIDSLGTKAEHLGITLKIDNYDNLNEMIHEEHKDIMGMMMQYPDVEGNSVVSKQLLDLCDEHNIVKIAGTDLLASTILKPPGEYGFDVCFGNTQRFGIPLWFGGPHPAFFATKYKFIRHMPGRIVGKSIDSIGNNAYRLALQTREQHIKQDKATSNICTSQSLLTNVVGMYGIYHQKEGLIDISTEVHEKTNQLATMINDIGLEIVHDQFFDTLYIRTNTVDESIRIRNSLFNKGIQINGPTDGHMIISVDQKTTYETIDKIVEVIAEEMNITPPTIASSDIIPKFKLDNDILRTSNFLQETPFTMDNDETSMLRYMTYLSDKDYSLCNGAIPLGSCTMKLNPTHSLEPLSWNSIMDYHPYTGKEYVGGYHELINACGNQLKEITGFDHVTFQSNSGATGEYVGLLCIKNYLRDTTPESDNNICLIPNSAHGTNFASAKLAGLNIKRIDDAIINDVNKFKEHIKQFGNNIACLMITYPGTNGVFQNNIKEIIDIVHDSGGLVYMDGANMNAICGLLKPAELGFDLCHLNLHKTFCIPHGGGGPGMGPILCNDKLGDYLPTNVYQSNDDTSIYRPGKSIGSVASSQYSSASLLTIPFSYIDSIGSNIRQSSEIAILNANYLKDCLKDEFTIIDVNQNGRVGHEFIIDVTEFKKYGITENDIAKRLIDYSFHPPTMSWPRSGALMFEPTESESLYEIHRIRDAMLGIKKEIMEVVEGKYEKDNNVLVNSPHCQKMILNWDFPYSMEKAFYPVEGLKDNKYWPPVSRVDNKTGDVDMLQKVKKLKQIEQALFDNKNDNL